MWNFCAHSETTAPDERGEGICLACRRVVVVRLTQHILSEAFDAVRRNGHSKRCVEVDGGQWVCATGCNYGRPRC
jgi:hypothetical protein